MYIYDDGYVYEKNIREILTFETENGIENKVRNTFDRLGALLELLHEKGIISEEEIFDIAEITDRNRFYTTQDNYDIRYHKNSLYKLVKLTYDPKNEGDWRIAVTEKEITIGTFETIKTAQKDLINDQKYK